MMARAAMCVGSLALAAPVSATVIGFGGLSGVIGSNVSSYTESGYTIAALSGASMFGTYQPIKAGGTVSNPFLVLPSGESGFDLTGGSFSLQSYDSGRLSSTDSGAYSLQFIGYFAGAQTYIGYTPPPTAQIFDRLRFSLQSFASSGLRIDSINVMAPVPEPATWTMMILGFGAVGATIRRRRTTVSFACPES